MIHINLSGTDTASACGIKVKARGASSPIPKLCRALIADGYAAHDIAVIKRGETTCFEPVALDWWANRDVTEGDAYSSRFTKHRPFSADVWA